MSQENVEATKRANAALNRGDFDGVEELYAADAVLQDLQNAPDQPMTVEGVQAIRENLKLWAAAFDKLRVDIEEYIEGPDAVICAAHWQGQGKTSGISIDVHQFDLYEFREGRVVRAVLGFRSKNEALQAAGRSEWSISEENVDLYRRGIEAFNRRDLEAFLALAHPDVVGSSRVLAIEGGSYRGHDGTREWWKDLLGVFPEFRIEVVWVRDAGDLTVSELRNSAHGEGSAAPLEEFVWQVSEWRDGRVVRWQMYESEQDALEAAGLSE